jgi:hypothetical protein
MPATGPLLEIPSEIPTAAKAANQNRRDAKKR